MEQDEEGPRFLTFLIGFDETELKKLVSEVKTVEEVKVYIDKLKNPNELDSLLAMQVLIRSKNSITVPQLLEAVQIEDINKLRCIIMILGERGSKASVPALLVLLDHQSIDVRCDVAGALAQIWDKRAFEPLINRLEIETSSRVKICLAESLGEFEDEEAIPFLINTYTKFCPPYGTEGDLAEVIINQLGLIGGNKAYSFLQNLQKQQHEFDEYTKDIISKALSNIKNE